MRLLLLALALSQDPKGQAPQTKAEANQPRPSDTRGTRKTPLVIEQSASDRERNARRDAEEREDKAATDDTTAFFAGMAFILAAFQAGFFYLQLRLLHRSSKDTEKAANAANASALAYMAGERAYVFLNTGLTERVNGGRALAANDGTRNIVIGNFGRTPAQIISIIGWLQYWLKDRLDSGTDPIGPHGFWLAPGANCNPIPVPMGVKEDQIRMAKQNDGQVALIGRIRYRDVFGKCYETGYCLVVDVDTFQLTTVSRDDLNYNKAIDCP